jgi:integrase
MAKTKKPPQFEHCKVTSTTHPKAPWRVSWPVERDGKSVRIRRSFATQASALSFAEQTERDITNHGVRFGELPPEARRAFDFYRDQKSELEAAGAQVPRFEDLVAHGLAEIRRKHRETAEGALPVCEAVEQFLAYKKSRVGSRQYTDLDTRLGRFARDFGTRLMPGITAAEIERWLSGLRSLRNPEKLPEPPVLGPLSRNHYRANLFSLFEHGASPSRGWCERNPLSDLEPETVKTEEPEAYAVEDATRLMQTALSHKPELVPVIALGMFCGLRVSEAIGFDLAKIGQGDEIRVTGKTGPRMVPVTEAFKAWYHAQDRRKGKAWLQSPRLLVSAMQELYALAGVDPITNGLRHSFISYRCAAIRDVARVADECGNSVQTIKSHYRQLVTEEAARRFFTIRPAGAAKNITNLRQARATA